MGNSIQNIQKTVYNLSLQHVGGAQWKQYFHWFQKITWLSAFFQGDTLVREVFIKNPEGPGFWILSAELYGLREGARNWYDRFYRHCLSLGFTPAPGDPAAYNYDRDGARGSLAIHVGEVLTAGNALFYELVMVPLLRQLSISKIEQKEFKFLGMRLKQTANFAVSLSQDTKDLPQGVDSFTEEKKQSVLKSLVGQLLYLDLTRPELAFLILDLSHSSSKTLDERLRVASALLREREPAKSIIWTEIKRSTLDLRCYLTPHTTRQQILVQR